MSMLHSLWQAALLVLLYMLVNKSLLRNSNLIQKRNFLFLLLATQLGLSIFTFTIYFTGQVNSIETFSITTFTGSVLPLDLLHTITPWLFTAYIVVLFFKITQVIYRWLNFQKVHKTGLQKPPIDLKLFTSYHANQFGIKRKVTLWLSSNIATPVTFGFFKPAILLPVALVNQLSLQQAETLIIHELTHIKANDYLLNWFLIIAENIFFFNPFIISLCKKIRLEREKYCDVNVMSFKYSPVLYAETLLQAERFKQLIPSFQLAAVNKKQQLLQRIRFFSNEKNYDRQKRSGILIPVIVSLSIILFCFLGVLRFNTAARQIQTSTIENNSTFFADAFNEMNNPVFINNILTKTDVAGAMKQASEELNRQKPVIEKKMKQLEPLLKKLKSQSYQLAKEVAENFAIPVTLQENDATRHIIINEEESGSKNASVKAYTLTFQNGQWVVTPEWKLAAREMVIDTLSRMYDTGIKRKRLLPQQ